MSDPATIKLFLVNGRSSGIRTAEVSNWSGMAIAGPKSEFTDYLNRAELDGSGVYFLLGQDPETGEAAVYIGEAENLRKRLPTHRSLDYWAQVVSFTSKDDNLTKAHVRYLEGRLIDLARELGHAVLKNQQGSGARLSESDTADMEVFLNRIRQLLPVLGSSVLSPISASSSTTSESLPLICKIRELQATGERTESGFVVFAGSQAVKDDRPSAAAWSIELRQRLLERGVLAEKEDHLVFAKDHEFSSPSAAAGLIRGGNTNGLTAWRHPQSGKQLKDLEADE